MDTTLTIFTGVLAFAILIQTLLFLGIYKSVRRIALWMDGAGKDLLKNITAISSKVDECLATIKGMGESLKPITAKLANASDIVHRRVVDLDTFLSETTNTARLEILRVQNTMQSAVERANEILEQLYNSMLAPINEICAISQGIRASINFLFRKRKSISSGSAQDEEMFI